MSKIEVTKVVFDTLTEQPELILKDGTSRVVYLVPTGNCWVEYWVTPEYLKKAEQDAKDQREKQNKEAQKRRLESESKKHWWQR